MTAALNLAAQAHAELDQLDAAAEAATRAVSVAPTDGLKAEALMTSSDIYLRRKEWEKALDTCQRALSLSPGNPIPYFNMGRAYLHTGQVAEAEQAYRDAVTHIKPADRWMLGAAMNELQQDAAGHPELAAAIQRVLAIIEQAKQ